MGGALVRSIGIVRARPHIGLRIPAYSMHSMRRLTYLELAAGNAT